MKNRLVYASGPDITLVLGYIRSLPVVEQECRQACTGVQKRSKGMIYMFFWVNMLFMVVLAQFQSFLESYSIDFLLFANARQHKTYPNITKNIPKG